MDQLCLSAASRFETVPDGRRLSPLRHAGLAQAGEISGFEQGTDLGHPPISPTEAGYARIAIIADQPASFGEFGSGALALAFEAIGSSEPGMKERYRRPGTPRLFEPG